MSNRVSAFMASIQHILHKAKSESKHIVLAEGLDERIIAGAVKAVLQGVSKITLLGPVDQIRECTRKAGDKKDQISIIDPQSSALCEAFAELYFYLRQHKSISRTQAKSAVLDPLNFANLMVHAGHVDGSVAGGVHTTTDVVRSAIQIIGMKADTLLVSSFFIMELLDRGPVIYSDCGLIIDPGEDELAGIARGAADSAMNLLGITPRIAMLSFATGSSARHQHVDKVIAATQKLNANSPELYVDGPIQFDAAIDPDISIRKLPDSVLVGQANVFVFPDLNSGNIAYKITERLAGAKAIGPILHGLAKPANDLSRGCDAEAVYNMIAVTAVQAGG